MNSQAQKLVFNAKEVAAALDISLPKVYQIFKSEGFPAVKIGSRIVVPIDRLNAWLNEQAKS